MSIHISDVKLPPDDKMDLVLCIRHDGTVFNPWGTELGKAVELPPHGRLIDADANIKALNACIEKPEDDIARECYKYAKALLNACPPIIPADQVKEDDLK